MAKGILQMQLRLLIGWPQDKKIIQLDLTYYMSSFNAVSLFWLIAEEEARQTCNREEDSMQESLVLYIEKSWEQPLESETHPYLMAIKENIISILQLQITEFCQSPEWI